MTDAQDFTVAGTIDAVAITVAIASIVAAVIVTMIIRIIDGIENKWRTQNEQT